MTDKAQKRAKRRVPVIPLLLLVVALALLFFFMRRVFHPKTITLVQTEHVEQSREGRAAFIFYEYAPDVFQHIDWPKDALQGIKTEIRYRVDTPLLKLDEPLRRRLESAATRLAGRPEEEYMQRMLKADAVLTPLSGLVYPFSDGYETLLTPASLNLLQPGDLGTENVAKQEYSGLKFVDNRLFYLALDLPQSVLPLDVQLQEEYILKTDKDVVFRGKLVRRAEDSLGRSLLIFTLRNGVLRARGERFATIRVVLSEADCYRLPSSAIFREGKQNYCFVLDKNHVAKKVPVHLMATEKQKDAYLVVGGKEKGKDAGLHRFDRVIIHSEEVKEGGLYRWD